MAEQLKLISYTDYAEVTNVDIYMPVSWLQVRPFKNFKTEIIVQ